MKKIKNRALLLLSVICIIAIISSCKKSSDSGNSSITKENLAGSYKLTALTVTIPPFPAQSVLDSLDACQRDDVIKLNLDLTMNYMDAGTKCDPVGDFDSHWNLSGNTITIDTTSGNIQKFDGKTLVITSDVTISNFSGTSTETFVKQ